MISVIPCLSKRSNVHSSNGLLSIGNRIFGRVQLRGLSRVAKPPARINAFTCFPDDKFGFIFKHLKIKPFRGIIVPNKSRVILEQMSWSDAKEYFLKRDIVLLPIGSTEQHGSANPLGTDFLIAARLGQETAKRTGVMCLPAIPFGVSGHHKQFWGTIFVSPCVLKAYAREVCQALALCGVKKIIMINGHGGNLGALSDLAMELRSKGVFITIFEWWLAAVRLLPDLFKPEERRHAGAEETSMNLALHGHLVDMRKTVDTKPRVHPAMVEGLKLPLDTVDETLDGVFGKQSSASVEKGKHVFDSILNELVRHVKTLESMSMDELSSKRMV